VAEIWGVAIAGVAAAGGAAYSAHQAGNAASAQAAAGGNAIGEQQRQFDTMLSLGSNQRAIGNQALNALGSSYGYQPAAGYANDEYGQTTNNLENQQLIGNEMLPPDAQVRNYANGWGEVWIGDVRVGTLKPGKGHGIFINDGAPIPKTQPGASRSAQPQQGNQLAADYSQFYKSPDYNFRMSEGLGAVQNSAAAQGGLYSGNALRGIQDYGQGVAAGGFQNWVNNQLALAGMGSSASAQAGQGAMQTGANVGNLLVNQGNARANGIVDQSNAVAGGINDLSSIVGAWRGGYFNRGGGGFGGGNSWANQAMMAGGG
jgi:hypothetical protein